MFVSAPGRDSGRLARARPTSLTEVLAFASSVAIVLIYSGIWFAPLTGYGAAIPGWITLFYYPAYVLTLVLIALRPQRAFLALTRSPFLIGLIALAAASTLWSIAPDETGRRVFALAMTSLSGVALASRWSWKQLIEIVAAAIAVSASR